MSAAPPVAIGLPVYNGERYLAETLDAILAQTYSDFELVISDNGSSDATEEICRAYARRDRRIRYERQDVNRGASWNYNRVFHLSSGGPYFKWHPYDDLLEPTYLERCVEVLDAEPSVVVAYARAKVIDDEGRFVELYDDPGRSCDTRGLPPWARVKKVMLANIWSDCAFGLSRRAALERTRLLGNYASADYILLAELAFLGEFHEIEDFLYVRRQHTATSRKVNRTPQEVAAWFDPARAKAVKNPMEAFRLVGEYYRTIVRAPLSPLEKAEAVTRLSQWILRKHRVGMQNEVVRTLKLLLGRGG